MRVLDLDLDFFMDNPVDDCYATHGRRPCCHSHPPWKSEEVKRFLEEGCGLTLESPIPGKVVEKHDEVFLHWREMILRNDLLTPFEVVHIDSHADLGLGYVYNPAYILTDILQRPPEERCYPRLGGEEGLSEGTYMAFAIACEWISSLTYVYPPVMPGDDIIAVYEHVEVVKGRREEFIRMQAYPPGTTASQIQDGSVAAERTVIQIPFCRTRGDRFRDSGSFDFCVLSCSPGYTPVESDALVPVVRSYINELPLAPLWKTPLGRGR